MTKINYGLFAGHTPEKLKIDQGELGYHLKADGGHTVCIVPIHPVPHPHAATPNARLFAYSHLILERLQKLEKVLKKIAEQPTFAEAQVLISYVTAHDELVKMARKALEED